MLIGELCKKTGLGKGAIRLYEELGLISSKPREAGSRTYREFDENTLARIELIKNGKRMGFKLKEGKAIIDAFMNDEMTIEIGSETIKLIHLSNAHTDGDALVYFAQSNVLHTGDTFFNGRFPFIDINRGGSIAGDIAAAKKGLMLINDETKIIPGHGALATKADYQKYHDMLVAVYNEVKKAAQNNVSLEEVTAMESITSSFFTDAETAKDFISGPKFRSTVYKSILQELETNEN